MKNKKKITRNRTMHWCLLALVLVLSVSWAAGVGSASLAPADSFRLILSKIPVIGNKIDVSGIKEIYPYILFQVRLPRIILSLLVGGALSVVGAVFQGLFRNPLADPHVLGVSSGAALGATVAILSGIRIQFLGLGAVGICAFAGALAAIFLVCLAAGTGRGTSAVNILLTGTAISTMLSAVISLMMTLHQDGIEQVYMWTLGSFGAASWTKCLYLSLLLLLCGIPLLFFGKELNLLMMGEESAQSLGVEIGRIKKLLVLLSSMLVAGCVSVSGMIAFVGLVIPHCMRMLGNRDNRVLLPACFLGGGAFMTACDTIARTITAPSEIPVGVITAIIGAPYFIWLIYKGQGRTVE